METALPVGREDELDAIERFLTCDAEGRAVGLWLEGEAGIGKTTLWRVALDRAEEHSYRVLAARAVDVEAQLPFVGLGDLLGGCVDGILDELPAVQRSALETALLLGGVDGLAPQPLTIAAAVLSSLRALAREGPLLVAVDDVQWLDPASAVALEFALRRIRPEEQIRFLASWRTPGSHPPLGIERLRDGEIERHELTPLSLGALHRIIGDALGSPLPRPALVRIHAASGGNPFFALELARVLAQRGTGVRFVNGSLNKKLVQCGSDSMGSRATIRS